MRIRIKKLLITLGFFQFLSAMYFESIPLYSVFQQKPSDIRAWGAICGDYSTGEHPLGLPVLGVYDAPYNFREIGLIIQNSSYLLEGAPEQVKKEVGGRDADFYTIFWGKHRGAPARVDNIVLHPVVRKWIVDTPDFKYSGKENFTDDTQGLPPYDRSRGLHNFSLNVPAGVFGSSDNVASADENFIPLQEINPINVNFHGHCQFSPNNGKIKFEGDGQIATFWLVALSPINNEAIVTFNIVAVDETLTVQFKELQGTLLDRGVLPFLDLLHGIKVNNKPVLDDAIRIIESDFRGVGFGQKVRKFTENEVREVTDIFMSLLNMNWQEAQMYVEAVRERLNENELNLFRTLVAEYAQA